MKRIYLALDDHTDYMWTADEQAYRQAFCEMLDYYLAQADETAAEPAEFQGRFNCDGSYWAWVYEQDRSPEQFACLMERVRDGHITLPLNPLILTYGGAPLEAVIRGMYHAGSLERRFDLRLPLALAMENQTMPYGLGAVWAGCGVKYSWKGICACASHVYDAWDRPHDMYWWVGPDGSRILMKWNSLLVDNKSMGGYAEARDLDVSMRLIDENPEFRRRYPYDVVGVFGRGWDDLKTLTRDFVDYARANSTPERRLIVSNEVDFFEDFGATYGVQIPTESSAYGNEWDLYTASLSEVFARVRRAVEALRAGEALSVFTGLKDPRARAQEPAAERVKMWLDLGLCYEHDLTADGPTSREARAAFHRAYSESIVRYSESLLADGTRALGGQIRKSGLLPRYFAFNPLSWARGGAVDLPHAGEAPCHVVDLSTGKEVPAQRVERGGRLCLQILAEEVPPLGYKVFEVQPGEGEAFAPAGSFDGKALDNGQIRVALAGTGAVESLVDRTSGGREMARAIDGRLINDLGAPSARAALEEIGPVSITVRVKADDPVAHVRRYTLVRGQAWLDIRNEITENFGGELAWAFSFNLENPDAWHEEVGAVIRAKLLSEGGQYAPTCARYDWLTLNHFVDLSEGGGPGVTLSNADCAFMQLGRSSIKKLDSRLPQVKVLAGGQVDGPSLGIPNQGGDSHFVQRFRLGPHAAYDAARAMRFALEHQNPLVAGSVTGGEIYPETGASLLRIDHPGVLLWALKPAEDGWEHGIIARVWNLTREPAGFILSLGLAPLKAAQAVTHLETPLREAHVSGGALAETLAPQQIVTYRLVCDL